MDNRKPIFRQTDKETKVEGEIYQRKRDIDRQRDKVEKEIYQGERDMDRQIDKHIERQTETLLGRQWLELWSRGSDPHVRRIIFTKS